MSEARLQGLYAITDCARLDPDELLVVTEQILRAGVSALQYRDKSGDRDKRTYEAAELRRLCARHGALFIINDDSELAASVQSDGVHLGREDCDCKSARAALGPDALIGVSCYNSLELAVAAQQDGADYVAFGSFFPSPSRRNTVPAQPELISQAKAVISLPIAAIGGITPANCAPLLRQGADMIAVISSVYQSPNPCLTVQQFNRLLSQQATL